MSLLNERQEVTRARVQLLFGHEHHLRLAGDIVQEDGQRGEGEEEWDGKEEAPARRKRGDGLLGSW